MSKKMKTNRFNAVSVPAEFVIHIILAVFCLTCAVPFIFVMIISFTAKSSIAEKGFSFFPNAWSTDAYKYVFQVGDQLWQAYFNSFLITIVGTILSVLICILYSYALYRKDFKFRNFFAFFSYFTMMFGGGLCPTYMVCKNILGLNDNYAALIVPLLVNPFNFIIMRTFFQSSIPESIIESAEIDGSSEYRTLFQIIVPISKPGIATIALLNALAYWNEWFIASLYIRKEKLYPLQYLLMRIQQNTDFVARNSSRLGPEAAKIAAAIPNDGLKMALVVFIVLPIACAYPFFQRYIVAGLTIGSVKG